MTDCELTLPQDMPPIRERLPLLREAAKTYGGMLAVPSEVLDSFGYVRYEDGEATTVMPVEKLAGDSLHTYLRNKAEERRIKQPFGEFSFDLSTTTGFGTTVPAELLRRQLPKSLKTIEDELEEGEHVSLTTFSDLMTRSGNRGYRIEPFEAKYESTGRTERANGAVLCDVGIGFSVYLEKCREDVGEYELEISEMLLNSGHISATVAEAIWTRLEKIKSRVTDKEELDKEFEETFGELLSESNIEGEHYELYDGVVPRGQLRRGSDGEHDPQLYNRSLYLRPIKDVLVADGFADVAASLDGVEATGELRAIAQKAVKTCDVAREFREREKELKQQRAGMTAESDIWQFNTELHALRDAQKKAMKTLYGFRDMLNYPEILARNLRRDIEDAQKLLTYESQEAAISTITFDARFDAEKDADPGKVSGDCTAGNPLPFGQKVGAHNIKVNINDAHVGNIYLLETVTEDGEEPVWHLDAIQVPSMQLDWKQFPPNLMENLTRAAEAKGIKHITINSTAHHISNYDYIVNAFLEYAGASNTHVEFDNEVGLPTDEEYDYVGNAATTKLQFPVVEGFSRFQGEGERQVILWSSPKAS